MKFAVIGGDRRSAILCSLLRQDGHRVRTFGLERAVLGTDISRVGCLQGALYGADCVVLPLPSVKNELINAPYADEPVTVSALAAALWPEQPVIGGALSEEHRALLGAEASPVADMTDIKSFVVKNAALTAEAAVMLLAEQSDRALMGSRVLVLGWGRIGSLLCQRLKALGCIVTAADRSEEKRAMAQTQGIRSCTFEEIPQWGGGFELAVNTVPVRVLDAQALSAFRQGAVLVELANGFDPTLAEKLGLKPIPAAGLPGKYAPRTAAEYMRDGVYEAVSRFGKGE